MRNSGKVQIGAFSIEDGKVVYRATDETNEAVLPHLHLITNAGKPADARAQQVEIAHHHEILAAVDGLAQTALPDSSIQHKGTFAPGAKGLGGIEA